jgi:hypothetical protein
MITNALYYVFYIVENRRQTMSLQQFKLSRSGIKIGSLLMSPAAIQEMETKSRANRPAVEAIGKDIADRVGSLSDDEKKMVGRWVKEILAPRGWKPDRKGRVAVGHFFARGTIYRPIAPSSQPTNGAARLATAQAIVAEMPHRAMTSDQLIAERRTAFDNGQ